MDKLIKRILEVAVTAGEGHVPSALSILDIVQAVYEVKNSLDRFVLSKGHGCLALYAVLEQRGLIPPGALDTFCQPGSKLLGHPELNPEWGIECTTGSLGHGLPIALGMALAKRIKGEPGRVFCLVGDGELSEGSCWEALLIASQLKLANLVLIIDNNCSSPNEIDGDSATSLYCKLVTFGWFTFSALGRGSIESGLSWTGNEQQPTALIVQTTKGQGIPEMEAEPAKWHHRRITAEDVKRWYAEGAMSSASSKSSEVSE